jgi:hypothetical protein
MLPISLDCPFTTTAINILNINTIKVKVAEFLLFSAISK